MNIKNLMTVHKSLIMQSASVIHTILAETIYPPNISSILSDNTKYLLQTLPFVLNGRWLVTVIK